MLSASPARPRADPAPSLRPSPVRAGQAARRRRRRHQPPHPPAPVPGHLGHHPRHAEHAGLLSRPKRSLCAALGGEREHEERLRWQPGCRMHRPLAGPAACALTSAHVTSERPPPNETGDGRRHVAHLWGSPGGPVLSVPHHSSRPWIHPPQQHPRQRPRQRRRLRHPAAALGQRRRQAVGRARRQRRRRQRLRGARQSRAGGGPVAPAVRELPHRAAAARQALLGHQPLHRVL